MNNYPVWLVAAVLVGASPLTAQPSTPAASPIATARADLAPRTNLPPAADDPKRPPNLRQLSASVWTDDVGVDDNGNVYDQYKRSPVGTWSNYDEAKASPYPIPDPLILKNGQLVKDTYTWWNLRRPEILNDFETEIYGRVPANHLQVTWEMTTPNDGPRLLTDAAIASGQTHATSASAHFTTDDVGKTVYFYGAGPAAGWMTTTIAAVVSPTEVELAKPAATTVARGRLEYGTGEFSTIERTVTGHIVNGDAPASNPVTISFTYTIPANATGPVPLLLTLSGGGSAPMFLAKGWGYAKTDLTTIQADNAAGLNAGVIGLVAQGKPRAGDDWGTLTAWSWGLSRILDYLETDPAIDAKRAGVEGHSRWGKAALWAAAMDQRWAIVFASCSGEGGAKLSRRNYGETVDDIAGSHWMAANFRKYAGHWNDLPVDANELIALVAPRPVFVTGATQDPWSDPRGEFLAVVSAGAVYRLLGKHDVGATTMPAPNVSLISGDLAFREHIGAHTDAPDWPTFLEFASRYLDAPVAKN